MGIYSMGNELTSRPEAVGIQEADAPRPEGTVRPIAGGKKTGSRKVMSRCGALSPEANEKDQARDTVKWDSCEVTVGLRQGRTLH